MSDPQAAESNASTQVNQPEAQAATGDLVVPAQPTAFVTEQDLAMYAAITGRRPVVEVFAQPQPTLSVGYLRLPEEAHKGFRRVLASMHRHPKITVWIRHFSGKAKQRISEAKYRLAG